MSVSSYVVGIDLGTTNSALASTPVVEFPDPQAKPVITTMAVPQIAQPGEVGEQLSLIHI